MIIVIFSVKLDPLSNYPSLMEWPIKNDLPESENKLIYIPSQSHNPRPSDMALTWRDDPSLSSSGTIADVGSHAYDTVRWIIGKDATRVLAHADTITPAKLDFGNVNLTEALDCGGKVTDGISSRKGNTVDYANIAWEFEGGVVGSIVLFHTNFKCIFTTN